MRLSTVIGLDMDEVLADLHTPWIGWLNSRFGWNRNPVEGFKEWDEPTTLFGGECYEFLTPHIYDRDDVRPFQGALDVVIALRDKGHDIRFATSCSPGSEYAKFHWLVRHGFLIDSAEFIPGKDKSKAACNVLVDDGFHNVKSFQGWGILLDRPHNSAASWPYRIHDLKGLLAYC